MSVVWCESMLFVTRFQITKNHDFIVHIFTLWNIFGKTILLTCLPSKSRKELHPDNLIPSSTSVSKSALPSAFLMMADILDNSVELILDFLRLRYLSWTASFLLLNKSAKPSDGFRAHDNLCSDELHLTK